MTRHLPAFTRALLLLCVMMLLGTAIAQEPLPLPPPPEPTAETEEIPVTEEIPAPEATAEPVVPVEPLLPEFPVEPVVPADPTEEPVILPDPGPGRFDPDNLDELPDAQAETRNPMVRGSHDLTKLDGPLGELILRFSAGDIDGSESVTRNYYLPRDRRGRYLVLVQPVEGVRSKALGEQITAMGGKVDSTAGKAVSARLDLPQIALLSADPNVALIQTQPIGGAEEEATSAVLRAPAGAVVSEGFDVANAMRWHNAGNTGTSVNIAIIDFGFGASTSANADLSCLATYPSVGLSFGGVPAAGNTRRGLDMAEVICDIAPGAKVRLYKVATSADLFDAITAAKNDNDIIVIGADFGVNFSPGDGTFGRGGGKNPYNALATAKASGVTVIAAAGNSNAAYRTFRMQAGNNVTVLIDAKPGDQINVSWNDWDNNPNGGAPREDMSITLQGVSTKPARGSGIPAHQFTVPANCTLVGGYCKMTLSLGGLVGNNSDVQVNVSGGVDRAITSVSGATVDLTAVGAGTLSRPADSPHVIAVGAVCSNYQANFPLEAYSARGPVYGPGGSFNGLPAVSFFGPDEVKPEIAGPSNVSVFNNQLSGPIEDANCNFGLRGTQASAAHVAGMTALLLNNSLVSGFSGLNAPINVLHYWRTHSVDLPLEPDPKGYDMTTGAGLAVLGMPDYDYDKSLTAPIYAAPNRLPPGACPAGVNYVGPRNAGNSDYDGTVDNPFQSIAHAAHIQSMAGAGRCVIVLPGEYVSPVLLDLPGSANIYGYSGVTLNAGVDRTTLVVQNKYWEPVSGRQRRAGVFVNGGADIVFGGFNFVRGTIYESAFEQPSMVAAKGVLNFELTRSRFNGISTSQPLVDIFGGSHGAVVSENRFINNNGLSGGSVVAVYDSGLDTSRVAIRGNRFEGNINREGSWPMISVDHNIAWVPMIRSLDSYTDIINNTMTGNTAEVLLQGATTATDHPHEFRVLGNAIVGNSIDTGEITGTPGPLIHGFYQGRIMIVNNTIAQNAFVDSGIPYNTLFARGDENPSNGGSAMNGSLIHADAHWEIHGNLIASNGSSAIVKEMDPLFNSGAGCTAFNDVFGAPDPGRGATNNWIFDSYQSNSGDCNDSFFHAPYGNIMNVNPIGEILGALGGTPNDPEYWSPNGLAEGVGHLKDGGPTAFLQANSNAILNAFNTNGLPADVRGDARINNFAVDIGAYEFTTFELLLNPISITADEDSGVIEFDINDPIYLTGGFPPYTATLVDAPDYYGNHCDSRFASLGTQGTAVQTIDADTLTIAYCPPQDFHTDSAFFTGINEGNKPRMIVDIRDAIGNSVQATINYTILSYADLPLTSTLSTTATVALNRPNTAPTNQVRLRPYVDFAGDTLLNGSKFFFSEWNNPTGTIKDQVDYDFVYTAPVWVSGSPELNGKVAFLNMDNVAKGIVSVNLAGVNPPAGTTYSAMFSYTVKDAHNFSPVVNTITINAVPAPEPFALLTPEDGFSVGNIDSFAGFTWQVSANAQKYDVVVARKIEPPYIEVLRLTGLTPQQDGDGLVCGGTTCVLTLTDAQKLNLIDAEYRWAVFADNQGLKVRSTNQFDFVVAAGRELLLNGGFEDQGANAKQAANWKLNNGTGDKRMCDSGAAGGACYFRFKAHASSAAKLVQNVPGIGREGDIVTLTTSIQTKNLKANTGMLQVVVKYTTGDKDKIPLTAPAGTQSFALASAPPLTLRFPVASYKVKLMIKKGKGQMALDNVSLNLDQKLDFNLLTPTDGTRSANPADITQLTWQPSAAAPTYQVLLLETLNPGAPVISGVFTAAADADALTCVGGQCTHNLPPLANGDYVWTVTASTGFEAANSPFNFTVDSVNRKELVVNGGFEANNKKGVPGSWTVQKRGKSVSVCETATTHPEYQGACAFAFAGGSNTKLKQKLPTAELAVGKLLRLSVSAERQKAAAGAQAKLTVTYTNGVKEVRKIVLPGLSQTWQTLTEAPITVTSSVKKAVVVLIYKGNTGKVLFDNVSVILSSQ